MTTIEEALKKAGLAAVALNGSAFHSWSPEAFQSELSARGLAVVPVQVIKDLLDIIDRVQVEDREELWVAFCHDQQEGCLSIRAKSTSAAVRGWQQDRTDAVKRARETMGCL